MAAYVNGTLVPPVDAASLDGIPADLAPHGAGQDGFVVTYDNATGDLVLDQPASGPVISSANPQPLGVAAPGLTGEASDAGHVHLLPPSIATAQTTANTAVTNAATAQATANTGVANAATAQAAANAAAATANAAIPKSILANAGDIVVGSAAGTPAVVTAVTAGRLLRSAGANTLPAFSTLTVPDTIARGSVLVASAANTVTALAAETVDTFLGGDGTDLVVRPVAQVKAALGLGAVTATGADAAAARAAISAALAPPARVGLASLSTSVGPRGTAGPGGVKGWTFVVALYVVSLPGATQQGLWSCSNGSTRGWGFLISGNTGNNKFSMYIPGSTNIDVGAALTTGAHKVAIAIDADGLHYGHSIDGAAATTGVSLSAGSAPAADAADAHTLGNWINGFYPATVTDLFHLVAIHDVADATELAALSATPSDLRVVVPSTLAAADMDLCLADVPYATCPGAAVVAQGTGRRLLVTAGTPTAAVR